MVSLPKIVILGHRGFIGSHLYAQFSRSPAFQTLGFSSKEYNLLDREQVEALSRQWDARTTLIFCAAIGRAKQNDAESFLKNVTMVGHVASVLKKYPVRHCIFLSSIDVYGPPPARILLDEKTSPLPDEYYGWAKHGAEFLLRKALEDPGTILTILRLSGVFGPGENASSPANLWMKEALRTGQISLYGDGLDQRDYVWVEDLYPVACRFIQNRHSGTFNIATGRSHSLLEIIEEIKKIVPKPVEVVRSESRRPRLDYRFDTGALQEAVGPFAWTPLSQGLKSLYAFYT